MSPSRRTPSPSSTDPGHEGGARRAARAGEEVVHEPEARVPEGGHRRVPVAADAGRCIPRSARRVRQAGRRAQADGDGQGDRGPDRPGQEAVLRRQPGEAREAAEGAGLHDGAFRADIEAQLLSEKIYDEVTKDVKVTDAEIAKYYSRTRASTHVAESRDVRHILVKTKAAGRQDLRRDQGRRRLRCSREEVLARPGLEGQRRQAHDHAGPDGRAVRHDRLPARDEPGLPSDQDRVRLPRDPADLRRQAGEDDAAQGRQAADPGAAPGEGEDRRDHQVDGRHEEGPSTKKVAYATGFAPPAAATDTATTTG